MSQDGISQLIDGWLAFVFANAAVLSWFAIHWVPKANQSSSMPWFAWKFAYLLPLLTVLPTLLLAIAMSWSIKIDESCYISYAFEILLALRATCIFITTFIEASLRYP
jgi:hypothetical protein